MEPIKMTAEEIEKFQSIEQKNSLVVNELGGTAGIVTIEDVMEEIFGEIDDEHDTESLTEKILGENEYLFSGRLEIYYINNKYDLNLPEGEYNTLGGFITANHEDIPMQGEKLVIDGFEFTIQKSSSAKIEEVVLKKINK